MLAPCRSSRYITHLDENGSGLPDSLSHTPYCCFRSRGEHVVVCVTGLALGGSRLRGKRLPSGMTGASSLWMGRGVLPLTVFNVRVRVFSRFLSFFEVERPVPTVLTDTWPNSSESSMELERVRCTGTRKQVWHGKANTLMRSRLTPKVAVSRNKI